MMKIGKRKKGKNVLCKECKTKTYALVTGVKIPIHDKRCKHILD